VPAARMPLDLVLVDLRLAIAEALPIGRQFALVAEAGVERVQPPVSGRGRDELVRHTCTFGQVDAPAHSCDGGGVGSGTDSQGPGRQRTLPNLPWMGACGAVSSPRRLSTRAFSSARIGPLGRALLDLSGSDTPPGRRQRRDSGPIAFVEPAAPWQHLRLPARRAPLRSAR
jgi:hypothetical protein